MHFTWTLVLAIVTFSSHSQTFFLDDNGVTIKCVDCQPGDQGVVNGVTYTAVNEEMLQALKEPWVAWQGLFPEPDVFEHVCTSLVTNMDNMFFMGYSNGTPFFPNTSWNPDISSWDVSNVNSMQFFMTNSGMTGFNPDLSYWDISNVTNIDHAFQGTVFDGNLENWNTSSITSMNFAFSGRPFDSFSSDSWWWYTTTNDYGMPLYEDIEFNFGEIGVFNSNISNWDVSNVTSFKGTFSRSQFNQDIGAWDVSSAVDMSGMFLGTTFDQDISPWNVSNVNSFSFMFSHSSFNLDLSTWDVSSASDFSMMFSFCEAFNQDVSMWSVASALTMKDMFRGCSSLNQDFQDWDVSNVQDMSGMFWDCGIFDGNITSWDVSSVMNMSAMLSGCAMFNQNVNGWNTSSLVNAWALFQGCSLFNQPLDSWDVSNVTNMGSMFGGCTSFNQNLNSWNVSNVTNMGSMFESCPSFNLPLSSWDVSSVQFMDDMFSDMASFNQPLNAWDVSGVEDMNHMFGSATSFDQDLCAWDVSNVTGMGGMFWNCETFNGDISSWDVSHVEDMEHMFELCPSFNQDLSCWCVELIDQTPDMFAYGSTYFAVGNWPQWGSCPDPNECMMDIECETAGCTDPVACNYDPSAVEDDGSCTFLEMFDIAGDSTPDPFVPTTYSYPGNESSTFEWSTTDGIIDQGQGSNSVSVVWANAGIQEISVTETNSDGCQGDMATLSVIVLATATEERTGMIMSVYPNPTAGNLTVNFGQGASQNKPVMLCSLDGRVLAHWSPAPSITLDLSGWESGIYIVRCGAMAQRFVLSTRNQ